MACLVSLGAAERGTQALFPDAGKAGAAASTSAIESAFAAFISKQGRKYVSGSKEYDMRKGNFEKAADWVAAHNSQKHQNWRAGINKYADQTHEELAHLRGWKSKVRPAHISAPEGSANTAQFLSTSAAITTLPSEHSWANLTTIKEVQDQGSCGSCWAFATSTTLRAHSEIWQSNPRTFSVEQIISCTANPQECGGTGGCMGATAELAMDYVFNHGCKTNAEIPYTQKDGVCPQILIQEEDEPATPLASASIGMLGWSKLPENRLQPLKTALVTKGPVAVSISAGHAWNLYEGGVLDNCPKDAIIDHAVVLFGYGVAKEKNYASGEGAPANLKYWHLQNSWGADWGEKGYIRMLRREDQFEESQQCGTDNNPLIGSGCKGGPAQVHVCGTCGVLYDTVIPHFADSRKPTPKKTSFLRQTKTV